MNKYAAPVLRIRLFAKQLHHRTPSFHEQRFRLLNNTRVFASLYLFPSFEKRERGRILVANASEEEEEEGSLQTFACTPMAKHCDANPRGARQEAGKTNYPPLLSLGDN